MTAADSFAYDSIYVTRPDHFVWDAHRSLSTAILAVGGGEH
jgi:hypothetical protein